MKTETNTKTNAEITKRRKVILNRAIPFLIVFISYLLYAHLNLPSNAETFGFIKGGNYGTARVYIFMFFSKLVPLLLLLIWFITCKHWWAGAIIIPLSVYSFQLIFTLNNAKEYITEVEFIYTTPFVVGLIVILNFLRSKLNIYIGALSLAKKKKRVKKRNALLNNR